MGILLWLVFGGLVGWVASMVMHTNDKQGMILNIVVGIIGAVVGGFIMQLFGGSGAIGFSVRGFLAALLGACVFIGLLKALR